jgi:hypothetical protein
MRARKLHNFEDKNLDRQIVELCNSQILPDLGGSTRRWIITGVNVVIGDDGNEYPQLAIQEIP